MIEHAVTLYRSHHVLTLLLDGKLFLAPLDTGKVQVCSSSLYYAISLLGSNYCNRKYLTLELEPVYPPFILNTYAITMTNDSLFLIDRRLGDVRSCFSIPGHVYRLLYADILLAILQTTILILR